MDPIKVLIVEDHKVVAETLAERLDREPDIQVARVVGTAGDAVTAARELIPDVVLMDYRLPDGDGASATARIKQDTPSIHVVMLTGEEEDSVLIEAIEAGCSGFLTKEKSAADVLTAIRGAASGDGIVSTKTLSRLLPKLSRRTPAKAAGLTPREVEILQLLAEGLSSQAIADRLVLALRTVRNHVQTILTKLQAHSRLEAVATAVREGLVRPPK